MEAGQPPDVPPRGARSVVTRDGALGLRSAERRRDPRRTVLILGVAAVPLAVLRFFAKGWLEPLGVPTAVGSSLASLTLLLLGALALLFSSEGRSATGRYLRTALAYAALAAWCEALVIAGILASARAGADTYYEGPWEAVRRVFPEPAAHAIGHTQGFLPRLLIAWLLGGALYLVSRRRRHA